MERITKYEPSDKSMFPYKLKDEELSTKLDSIHKLGKIEDIMEKYKINSVEELERVILNDATSEQSFKDYVQQFEKELKVLVDIEEKLDIDLITYFKIKNAKIVYVKESYDNISEMLVRSSENSIDVCYKGFAEIPECDKALYFKDYGKTWALTKEELKNENN